MNSILNDSNKRFEEMVIIEKIEKFIKKDRYNNIDDFIMKNPDFNSFLRNNKLDAVLSRSRNSITEEDYLKIITKIKENHKKQQQHNDENINTTNIGNKKIVTFKNGEQNFILDDSYNKKDFNKQLDDLQKTSSEFRTTDVNKNTNNMMNQMRKDIKQEIAPRYLRDINQSLLNDEERKLLATAMLFQEQINASVKIDMNRKLIFDNDNNVYSMEKRENGIVILPVNNHQKKNNIEKKDKVKKLIKTPITTGKNGFVDAAILAFVAGSMFGSIALSLYCKIIEIVG